MEENQREIRAPRRGGPKKGDWRTYGLRLEGPLTPAYKRKPTTIEANVNGNAANGEHDCYIQLRKGLVSDFPESSLAHWRAAARLFEDMITFCRREEERIQRKRALAVEKEFAEKQKARDELILLRLTCEKLLVEVDGLSQAQARKRAESMEQKKAEQLLKGLQKRMAKKGKGNESSYSILRRRKGTTAGVEVVEE